MASIRLLKKEMNSELSAIIEECYTFQLTADKKGYDQAEKIIDEAIETFDQLIAKIYQKNGGERKANLKSVRAELHKKSEELLSKINKLNS